MNIIDYKAATRVKLATHMFVHVNAYKCMIFVHVICVSNTCHTCLTLNLQPVCTVDCSFLQHIKNKNTHVCMEM